MLSIAVTTPKPGTSPPNQRDLEHREFQRVEAGHFRLLEPDGEQDAAESRSIELSFSSEYPVERFYGNEVLSHDGSSVDLSRLNDGAPLLFNHDPDRVIGVVERAWIDGTKKRGMAEVRFSRNAFAQEVLSDIRDGVLRNVSVGYGVGELEKSRDRENTYVATSWQPHEVSVVSVPADPSIGIGRSLGMTSAADAATTHTDESSSMDNTQTPNLEEVRAAAKAEAIGLERARVASITALCEEHGCRELATGLIDSGATEADAMKAVLADVKKQRAKQPAQPAVAAAPKAQPISESSADIGLSQKEARSFSFVRAIRALANPGDRAAQEDAAFEREVSRAVEQATGQNARGILVPNDVMRRDLTVATASGAGDLVFTDARPGSFIELLRNRMALNALGITTLSGLQGNVAIPRQTGASTAYWVSEGGSPTESQPTVDQVTLMPRTVGAYTDFTRRLMLQSSIDVEQMVRNELATVLALEIDRVGLYGLGNSGEPLGIKLTTGINTKDFAADSPTYAELVAMETEINADNADIGAMAYLTNATRTGAFKTTEKASGTAQFVYEPGGTVNGYRLVTSNQVASGDVFFAVWNQLVLGLWSSIDLTVDTTTLNTSGGVRVIALQDVDYAVRHPEAFCRGNNTL
jgi:HK97 family phage major capsid protein/HK97 family phage prohead protease